MFQPLTGSSSGDFTFLINSDGDLSVIYLGSIMKYVVLKKAKTTFKYGEE